MATWVPVLSWHTIHKEGVLQIYFRVIFWGTVHLKQAYFTSDAFIHPGLFFLAVTSTQQHIWVDDFTGHCLLWKLLSSKTFSGPTVGLTTNLGLGQSWLFSASSINFLTRRNLKSMSVYLAPHEGNSSQLLSTVRSRRWENNFMVHLLVDQQKDEHLCSLRRSPGW